jgi:hypothetical protein
MKNKRQAGSYKLQIYPITTSVTFSNLVRLSTVIEQKETMITNNYIATFHVCGEKENYSNFQRKTLLYHFICPLITSAKVQTIH